MKTWVLTLTILFCQNSWGQIQSWVLESIKEMPSEGGYQLNNTPARRMGDAFQWNAQELLLNEQVAVPSYCTTATYMIFYKVLQKYWASQSTLPTHQVLALLKPDLEPDGLRIWGRWNSNGPGTAKFFHDTGLGYNFDDLSKAEAGDFLKIFWNNEVGKKEKGHTVIFLGREIVNGVEMIRFWSSNTSTNGFGDKLIPKSDTTRLLFSRLEKLDALSNILLLKENDAFLASMLTRESSWEEVKTVSGM